MKISFWPFLLVFAIAGSVSNAADESLHAQNFAARLTVNDLRITSSYGSNHASAGKKYVVLAVAWEDIIDPKLAGERDLPLAYGVPELGQHLYLVVNGNELGLLHGDWSDGSERKSFSGLTLTKPGDKVTGDLVFEVGEAVPTNLALRFYDDTAGDFGLSLRGTVTESQAIVPILKNQVSEFGVFGVKDPSTSPPAPAGFRTVEIDLRARSVWRHDVPATGFDPALDWTEVPKYLHVLTAGDYAYPPVGDTASESVRFIPEFFTGFHAKFFIPADAQTLRLVCAMPHAATDNETLDLAPMIFELPGSAKGVRENASSEPKPVLTLQDEMFSVAVTQMHLGRQFAGSVAGDGQQFLVLNFSVRNNGKSGEFFQPAEQLFVIGADGAEIGLDEATWQGTHRPETQLHFPPGSHRQFEVAFRIPKDAALKLSFHGGEFQKVYDLPTAPAQEP